jgi:hypothetical protein
MESGGERDTDVGECAANSLDRRFLQIGVIEDQRRGLPTQFEEHRLDILARGRRDDRANVTTSGEVDLLHGWVSDQGGRDRGRIRWTMDEEIDTSFRKACLAENIAQRPESPGAEFGTLEDGRVSGGERERDGSSPQDERSIPISSGQLWHD